MVCCVAHSVRSTVFFPNAVVLINTTVVQLAGSFETSEKNRIYSASVAGQP